MWKTALSVTILSLAAFVPLALAQGTYTQIDVPGAKHTYAYGIDTAGDIVGYFVDADDNNHGFLMSAGAFTTIDVPTSDQSYAFGINNEGQIVGGYRSAESGVTTGFLYDIQSGAFRDISYPESTYTLATGINDSGVIVGYAYVHTGPRLTGFELLDTTFIRIGPQTKDSTWVTAINNSGVVAGFTGNGRRSNSFLFNGEYHEILKNVGHAQAYGISDSGVVVGFYTPNVGQRPSGFVCGSHGHQRLQFPNATATYAAGVNDDGEVVGLVEDSTGATIHGFAWTPPAGAAKK